MNPSWQRRRSGTWTESRASIPRQAACARRIRQWPWHHRVSRGHHQECGTHLRTNAQISIVRRRLSDRRTERHVAKLILAARASPDANLASIPVLGGRTLVPTETSSSMQAGLSKGRTLMRWNVAALSDSHLRAGAPHPTSFRSPAPSTTSRAHSAVGSFAAVPTPLQPCIAKRPARPVRGPHRRATRGTRPRTSAGTRPVTRARGTPSARSLMPGSG